MKRRPRNPSLGRIERMIKTMSQQLDHLTKSVADLKSVDESASALIAGLADQLRSAKDDPAAIEALAADLDADKAKLAAAVAANQAPVPAPPAPPAA